MNLFTSSEIAQFRKDTPGTSSLIHLNNAGAAFMPLGVKKNIDHYLQMEMDYGGYETAALQKEGLDAFYTNFAKLINAKASQIAFATNATDAYNKALSAIPFRQGDVILTTLNDYVSNQIAFLQIKQLWGVQIVHARDVPEGGVDPQDMVQKMDQYHPKLVAVTHVPTNSGLIQPIEAIGKACRERNILYLVDACQSIGQLVLDVEKIGCDFLSGTGRKFLRGPRGTGFLFVSDRVLEQHLAPLFLDLHSAAWSAEDEFEALGNAKRFELWEKPYAFMLGAAVAAAYTNEIGMDRIEKRVKWLAQYLRDGLQAIPPIRVLDLGVEKAGIVTLHLPDWQAPHLHQHLLQQGINSAYTSQAYNRFDMGKKKVDWLLRLSPHYYNTVEELDVVLKVMENIVAR